MGAGHSKALVNATDVVTTSLKFMDPIQALFQAVGPLGVPATALFSRVKGIFSIIKRHKDTHTALAGLIGVLNQLEVIMQDLAHCGLPQTDAMTRTFGVFEDILNRAYEILKRCEKRSGAMNIIRDSLADLRDIEKSLREEIPILNLALSAAIYVRIQQERGCACPTGVETPQISPAKSPDEDPRPPMAIDAVCFLLAEFPRSPGRELERSFKVGEVMLALSRHFRPIWREQYADQLREAIDLNRDGRSPEATRAAPVATGAPNTTGQASHLGKQPRRRAPARCQTGCHMGRPTLPGLSPPRQPPWGPPVGQAALADLAPLAPPAPPRPPSMDWPLSGWAAAELRLRRSPEGPGHAAAVASSEQPNSEQAGLPFGQAAPAGGPAPAPPPPPGTRPPQPRPIFQRVDPGSEETSALSPQLAVPAGGGPVPAPAPPDPRPPQPHPIFQPVGPQPSTGAAATPGQTAAPLGEPRTVGQAAAGPTPAPLAPPAPAPAPTRGLSDVCGRHHPVIIHLIIMIMISLIFIQSSHFYPILFYTLLRLNFLSIDFNPLLVVTKVDELMADFRSNPWLDHYGLATTMAGSEGPSAQLAALRQTASFRTGVLPNQIFLLCNYLQETEGSLIIELPLMAVLYDTAGPHQCGAATDRSRSQVHRLGLNIDCKGKGTAVPFKQMPSTKDTSHTVFARAMSVRDVAMRTGPAALSSYSPLLASLLFG
ncbi:hypothetical protein PAPYR_13094 [Paratrimastix pyriformis]|uniref:Uncharacterized protein n=1 Tax=Paratrimastix pyriformis TaxID=342808 RepID=A0ABQ8U2D9_9EUKA|nr:hypothetical protein PAPYR_13094 [Paratrimastix pyriformis]